jgi:hypothetical protein
MLTFSIRSIIRLSVADELFYAILNNSSPHWFEVCLN